MSRKWSWASTGNEVVNEFADKVKGRIFLITGPSEGGIGAETALSLARASPSAIILAGRDRTKIDPIIKEIHDINAAIKTIFIPLDLADQLAIRAAAAEVTHQVSHIDVLINNAAVMACPYTTTRDGLEMQFGTNYIGPFLFTNLLLPKIRAAGPGARIVNVASSAHRFSGIRFDDIGFQNGKEYDAWSAYGQSKSANILTAIYLAANLKSQNISVFSLHPGSIASSLQRHLDPESTAQVIATAARIPNFENTERKSLQQGCATTLIAALDPALKDHSGSYLSDGQVKLQAEHACGLSNAERLWKLSESVVGQDFKL